MPLDRNYTPLEPFDVRTPRLTYEEVRVLVGDLPDAAIAELAAGPIEVDADGKLCGVCSTLRPFARRGRRGEETEDVRAAADLLIRWHDALEPGRALALELGYESVFGVASVVDDQIHGLLGNISHARCCTIYALATVEMIERIATIARPKGSNA